MSVLSELEEPEDAEASAAVWITTAGLTGRSCLPASCMLTHYQHRIPTDQ